MREPLQQFKGDTYERPNQPWICGLAEEGAPCPMGPGKRGRCPAAAACHPIRDGDRWWCNRSAARGGPCDEGPLPDGECAHVYRCAPIRSLRLRRGRFVIACTLATLGLLAVMLSADWRNEVLAPGDLSVAHAQLLARGEKTDRCASCHAAGNQTLGQWLRHAVDDELAMPTQSQLCLECHGKQLGDAMALSAHNVDPKILLAGASASTTRRLDPTGEFACATCHREHHGAAHDLSAMSDHACQACHQAEYHSFAGDHPEFDRWPTSRRTRIAFDHAAHQLKHHPKEKQEFVCAACHQPDSNGDFQATLSYEATCAGCHDSKIAASWDSGIAMFSLPTIDVEALRDAGHDIGQWPEEAIDDFDGALPTTTKLLLATDEGAAAALAELGVGFDFYDVDIDSPEQLAAAAMVIRATKQLLYEVTSTGQNALRSRVELLLGRQLDPGEFAALSARLSPDTLAAITERWLTRLPEEFGGQDPAGDPAQQPPTGGVDRDVARERLAAGGWYRDDRALSIRYRPVGHADPWLTAWINVAAEASDGKYAATAEPLLRRMMAPTAAGQCGSCHSVDRDPIDRDADDHLAVQWLAKQPHHTRTQFTRFSHGPHLLQPQFGDCTACHEINAEANVMASYDGNRSDDFVAGFKPLSKATCAECHTRHGAGDSCLQCHHYHAGIQNRE